MVWVLLIGAIISEVIATSFLKLSDGLTKLGPSVVMMVGYLTSFVLLSQALKRLQVGIAYAIWSGVGTAAIALIGVLFLKEPASLSKVVGLLLIIAGVVVINLAGSTEPLSDDGRAAAERRGSEVAPGIDARGLEAAVEQRRVEDVGQEDH